VLRAVSAAFDEDSEVPFIFSVSLSLSRYLESISNCKTRFPFRFILRRQNLFRRLLQGIKTVEGAYNTLLDL